MTDTEAYARRRAALLAQMQSGIAIVPTAPERVRNRDSEYLYRYDSYFYYLCGFQEPQAVLVLIAGAEPQSLLFCREKNLERETWDGFRFGPEAAREAFGVDAAYPIAQLDEKLPALMANQPALYYAPGMDADWDARIMRWLNQVRAQSRTGVSAPQRIHDVRAALDEMRLLKNGHELELMRRAAAISAKAHERAMRATRPGRMEYEIEAELLYEFRRRGAQFPAYWPIVGGGVNGCILHYRENNCVLNDGDLVLIDAGAEFDCYAADITRTFPANGRYRGEQRAAYEIVLAAQGAAMAEVRAGKHWNEPHDAAVKVLTRGLVDLGLLKGDVGGLIEKGDYKRFYMHRTGHWLGMDVHDVGDYKVADTWREFEPGMVLTVEPGLYIAAAADIPEGFHNIGIRIEDDVLVTRNGCEVLTQDAPKTIDEIEALMRG